MCETVGVGVRVFARVDDRCADGGGVPLAAFSMRLDWTLEIAAAVLAGMVACAGCGVAGSDMTGSDSMSTGDSCESMVTCVDVALALTGLAVRGQVCRPMVGGRYRQAMQSARCRDGGSVARPNDACGEICDTTLSVDGCDSR